MLTVQPDRQRRLVELLAAATDEVMRHLPGFVAATIHASTDGATVVNYARWEPHLYTVESVHHG